MIRSTRKIHGNESKDRLKYKVCGLRLEGDQIRLLLDSNGIAQHS